jgi:hypothetical protein
MFKKIIQSALAIISIATLATLAFAQTIPYTFLTTPYAYDQTTFPANQLNNNFNYLAAYTNAQVAAITAAAWQIVTISGTAAVGQNYAVDTNTVGAITMTLPAPPSGSPTPYNSIKFLDAYNKFGTHALTINASGIAPINTLTNASAVFTGSTNGEEIACTYLNATIGYNCNIR